MIRFGLAGIGRIGEVHARNLAAHPRADLSAVVDVDRDKADRAAERYGCRAMESFDALVADPVIDAIVIASPTNRHADQAVAAARSGKAVLCEKPLSLDLATAKQCATEIADFGTPFMIALNKRFDPTIVELAARLHAGEIGEIEAIALIGKDPAPPPEHFIDTSGGIFRDMMVHDIDLAVFLGGELPVDAWAAGSVKISDAFARANDFDTAAVIMRTGSGIIVTQTLSRRSAAGFDQRIEVHGSKGTLRTANHAASCVESLNDGGQTRAPFKYSFLERFAASYVAELEAFITSLETGRPIETDIHHAIKIQTIADAVSQAAHSGQRASIRY